MILYTATPPHLRAILYFLLHYICVTAVVTFQIKIYIKKHEKLIKDTLLKMKPVVTSTSLNLSHALI